ncbi:serine hydrolase domain-containing protein [Chryseobacterium sp. MFBS3-17]|uniref:serine hydrolase domain-containing protein n=1 Tax=Chryseobacterium sp. MFBS3-17 TaxID=2886689 RepID=UPI001D0F2A71|nr:serine hydrolase domain-containing protein [Chryseobacterium sp. MFBS3-17]MCC2590592.1 beta-lactamase family protein [Chryseobacterium sp. MFBS3-17]
MKNCLWLSVLCLFLLFSCKKEVGTSPEEPETLLPNFGNVNLDDVFHKKDSRLASKDSVHAVIEQYYSSVWEGGDVWGGFLIAKGDDILYEGYRGFAQDHQQSPITQTTPLHVASISKSITAMAVLKLVEAGKLALEDEVSKYFPGFPYPGVTVMSLLTQRSGLPKYEYFIEKIDPAPAELSKKFLTNQDIMNMMLKYKPEAARAPDTGFMYCNSNYAVLALLIEKVTGTYFPDAMEQMVFKPLKMKNSFVFQEKDTLTAAKSFYNRGPKVHPYDRLDLIYGDKNVYTTPRDLFNFSKAMYAPDFLRADLKQMIFQPYSNEKPGINNYGIGFRMKVYDDSKLTYHTGWWHGTNSVFAHLLGSNVTIVSIGNKFSRLPYTALALASLFGQYPVEIERLRKTLDFPALDSANSKSDSAAVSAE